MAAVPGTPWSPRVPSLYPRSVSGTATRASRLPYTGDAEADRLLVEEPVALLIGFVLDQQVPLQRAFSAPRDLGRRLGTIQPAALLAMDPERVVEAFSTAPALHRFPRMMAGRVLEVCRVVVEEYGGDAARIWEGAGSGRQLHDRLRALPGVGEGKARTMVAVLGKQLGVRPAGWRDWLPDHLTLGDVSDEAELEAYQAQKRARRREARAGLGSGG